MNFEPVPQGIDEYTGINYPTTTEAMAKQPLGMPKRRSDLDSKFLSTMSKKRSPAKPLRGYTLADLYADYVAPGYLVKGIVDSGDLVVIFGESGAMKSFLNLDLLLHAATGTDFYGHRVKACGVLLIVGEGGAGIRKRLKAWLIGHGIVANDEQPTLYVADQPAELMTDAGAIATTIEVAEKALGRPIEIVSFDTLATNFGQGDENKTPDMNLVLAAARSSCGERAIVFIHHVGHGDKERERGSYALRAGADRRLLVERPGDGTIVTVKCLKSKDDEPFAPLRFEWRKVDLGWLDADGEMLTSLVLEPTEKAPPAREPTGKVPRAVMAILRESGEIKKTRLKALAIERGVSRSQVYAVMRELIEARILSEAGDAVAITEKQS